MKGITSSISNLKNIINEVEANTSRSIVQQIKMLEEKIDEKIESAIKPLNSRIDEVHESIFTL